MYKYDQDSFINEFREICREARKNKYSEHVFMFDLRRLVDTYEDQLYDDFNGETYDALKRELDHKDSEINELKSENDDLKEENAELRDKIEELEERVEDLEENY